MTESEAELVARLARPVPRDMVLFGNIKAAPTEGLGVAELGVGVTR